MILQTDVILNAYFRQMEPSGCATLLPFWSANKYNRSYVDRGLIVSKLNKWIDHSRQVTHLHIQEAGHAMCE